MLQEGSGSDEKSSGAESPPPTAKHKRLKSQEDSRLKSQEDSRLKSQEDSRLKSQEDSQTSQTFTKSSGYTVVEEKPKSPPLSRLSPAEMKSSEVSGSGLDEKPKSPPLLRRGLSPAEMSSEVRGSDDTSFESPQRSLHTRPALTEKTLSKLQERILIFYY